ncbi:MAG: DAK2 domain-containing protein [Dehalococcoidia bacterium]|nr:DAK2 domain-containing protein [Dehalococcoidia bacterium]
MKARQTGKVSETSQSKVFDGKDLKRVCQAFAAVLERNVESINALNVYPVPDGDTGTNMFLTMRTVNEELAQCTDNGLSAVAAAMARGALLGARGNSGVISSQFLRGMAGCFKDVDQVTAAQLAEAFAQGAASAYKAVSKPQEGTMLTVMRAASEATARGVKRGLGTSAEVFRTAYLAASRAVQKTPEQLPILKQAGVVDAGGKGFALMLQAAAYTLQGKNLGSIRFKSSVDGLGRVRESFLTAVQQEEFGYCIQFTLEHIGVGVDVLRQELAKRGNSVVVIGDEDLAKVHVHGREQEPVLAYGRSVGVLERLKVDNIDAQHEEFVAARRAARPRVAVAVVAVAWGQGIEKMFGDLGVTVIKGGQTMNPSVQDLLQAVEAANADAVVVLPNNSNIIGTANQAAGLSQRQMHVIPTRSLPQGIAAALAFNPEEPAAANLEAMERAVQSVRSGEVVAAVRSTKVLDVHVPQGAIMGLLDDELISSGPDRTAVLTGLVKRGIAAGGSLVTLYLGGDLSQADADRDVQALKATFPGIEVELVQGGQPHYLYLVSIE